MYSVRKALRATAFASRHAAFSPVVFFLVVVSGVVCPFLARLAAATKYGFEWFSDFVAGGLIGTIFIVGFSAIPFIVFGIMASWKSSPRLAVWLAGIVTYSMALIAYGTLDLRADPQASISLIFAPIYITPIAFIAYAVGVIIHGVITIFGKKSLSVFPDYLQRGKTVPMLGGRRLSLVVSILLSTIATLVRYGILANDIKCKSEIQTSIDLTFSFLSILLFFLGFLGMFWLVMELLIIIVEQFTLSADQTKKQIDLGQRIILPVALLTLTLCLAFSMHTLAHWYFLKEAAASHTSSERLRYLYKIAVSHCNHDLLMEIAENPACPPKILSKLVEDTNSSIRCRVVLNPRTPVRILEQLAKNRDWHIRSLVSANPSIPCTILKQLQNDKHADVRLRANYYYQKRCHDTEVRVLREEKVTATKFDKSRRIG